MLLTDINRNLYKHLLKCQCVKSVMIKGKMFSFGEKFNYKNGYDQYGTIILFINESALLSIDDTTFKKHFINF